MIGHLILRLAIWFLLTANLSVANIIIGVSVAFLLPRSYTTPEALQDWLRVLRKIIMAIPLAYVEAFELILRPHNHEDVTLERVKARRSPRLIFLDIFLITFTPKTIVLKYQQEGWYEVHRVRRRKQT
ncbi:MAG: Na+/H+ antiporter subunit E [Pelatocladus maniniholoensis HA4357-MV3]|jgi:multicomponent Na+:H+ antiporter subunit E|uniref:Na+/H+ antiporter subunit E n=1 Tax=Pelatocladus maniniholoensis HA4357-MV3 TaxID=1117104 RepID=A0A9E3H689_9NOST|nr:Na+/H+ antiporter subunit E [Pelatocladus maniniholoensis HA4357-MV3]